MARRLTHRVVLLGVAILAAAACVSHAQALRDPTRPPGPGMHGAGRAEQQSGWNLQSVLISPERRYAIINGEVVPVGGTVAGAELVAVAPERVTLRTRDGLRIVRLFPDVVRPGDDGAAGGAKGSEKKAKAEKSGSKN